jgi:hypothetical protein
MPPDAGFRGAAWRDEWLARLEATPPWTLEWLRHQTDGPYYRQGSLAPGSDVAPETIRPGDAAPWPFDGLATDRRVVPLPSDRSDARGAALMPIAPSGGGQPLGFRSAA